MFYVYVFTSDLSVSLCSNVEMLFSRIFLFGILQIETLFGLKELELHMHQLEWEKELLVSMMIKIRQKQ